MIEFTPEQKYELTAIAKTFGEDKVLLRLAEELGEASVAALQYLRSRKGDGHFVARHDAFLSELADACVMMEQALILNPLWKELIEGRAESKIIRTLDRYDIKEPEDGEG